MVLCNMAVEAEQDHYFLKQMRRLWNAKEHGRKFGAVYKSDPGAVCAKSTPTSQSPSGSRKTSFVDNVVPVEEVAVFPLTKLSYRLLQQWTDRRSPGGGRAHQGRKVAKIGTFFWSFLPVLPFTARL